IPREGGARRADSPELLQLMRLPWPEPRLHTRVDVCGARSEEGHPRRVGQPPEGIQIREARTAVVEDDRRTEEKPTHQVIPHHPAGAREPEESVARSEVIVEREDFEMLEQNPAVAVDDWLRKPRRA